MSTEILIIIATMSKAAELLLTTQAQGRDPTPEELESINTQYRAAMDGLAEACKPADTLPGA